MTYKVRNTRRKTKDPGGECGKFSRTPDNFTQNPLQPQQNAHFLPLKFL